MKEKKWMKIWESGAEHADGIVVLALRYLHWMAVTNYSPRSIESIQMRLTLFLQWCEKRNVARAGELSKAVLADYCRHLYALYSKEHKPLSRRTWQNYLGAVCTFCKWLALDNHVLFNPADEIRQPGREQKLPEVLTREEVEWVVNEPDIESSLGMRDRAMIETLYSSGVRAAELAKLDVEDMDLSAGLLQVREGKGAKDRMVPLGERACLWVSKYLQQVRPLLCRDNGQKRMFLTCHGRPIAVKSLSQFIGRHIRSAGVNKGGACHLLRHTMATHMLQGGADIRHIQKILGHTLISTTEIYTRVTIDNLREVYDRTHPSAADKMIPDDKFEPEPLCEENDKVPHERKKKTVRYTRIWQELRGHNLVELGLEFLRCLQVEGYSPMSIKSMSIHLAQLLDWCRTRDIFEIGQINLRVLEGFQDHLYHRSSCNQSERLLSARFRKQILVTLRRFFDWLCRNNHILVNFAQKLSLPKIPNTMPRNILNPRQIQALLSQPDISTDRGIRDRAILETLYATGIRREELKRLNMDDIDYQNRCLRVRSGKGRKDRIVPIADRSLRWIETYTLQVRPSQDKLQSPVLFLSSNSKSLHLEHLSRLVRQYLQSAKIDKTGSCHILRHSMATHMLDNGADIRYIKEILGHASLNTTQVYTNVSIRKLKEVHNRTHPSALNRPKSSRTTP